MDNELKATLLTILKTQADIVIRLQHMQDVLDDDFDVENKPKYKEIKKKLSENLEKRKQLKFKELIGEAALLKMDLILKQNNS